VKTAALAVVVLFGCGAPASGPAPAHDPAPHLRVLGTVQDGGLPHAACSCARCEAARTDPRADRRVASLALVGTQVHLVDATPDIVEQLELLRDVRDAPTGSVDRSPVDGILLTHAHIGHYLGLAHLGFEAAHTKRMPVFASTRMGAFLRDNGPWNQLLRLNNIELRDIGPGVSLQLDGVTITPILVPHRDEYSDTLGFRFQGPSHTVLYVPDTEPWDNWPRPIEDELVGVDVALLDGTFYSTSELPGRPVQSIGHPTIVGTMERLEPLVALGLRVVFTHLNHSNPALDPRSDERKELERRGFAVLAEGEHIEL